MNQDIRLKVNFWEHPKTVKLERRLGLAGVKALLVLWMWTAKNKPNGNFLGLDVEDIEIAAGWTGETGALVSCLVGLRFLDQDEDQYFLHNWEKHNPWAFEAETRSNKARLSKLAQINPAIAAKLGREGKTGLNAEEYNKLKKITEEKSAKR